MKIGEYEQMMSWLTRPEAPAPIEPRQMYNQGSSLDHAVRTIDPVQDSGNKIEEALKAYGKYQGDRKGGRMSFSKFFELYSTENFAVGGRVGFEDAGLVREGRVGSEFEGLFSVRGRNYNVSDNIPGAIKFGPDAIYFKNEKDAKKYLKNKLEYAKGTIGKNKLSADNPDRLQKIDDYVKDYKTDFGRTPSTKNIKDEFNSNTKTVEAYEAKYGKLDKIKDRITKTQRDVVNIFNDPQIVAKLKAGKFPTITDVRRITKLDPTLAESRLVDFAEKIKENPKYKTLADDYLGQEGLTGKEEGFGGRKTKRSRVILENRFSKLMGLDQKLQSLRQNILRKIQGFIPELKGQLAVDEIAGLTSSMRRGSGPYAIFGQVLDRDFNSIVKGTGIDKDKGFLEKSLVNLDPKDPEYKKKRIELQKNYNDKVIQFENKANADNPAKKVKGVKLSFQPPSKAIKNKKVYNQYKDLFDAHFEKYGYSFEVPADRDSLVDISKKLDDKAFQGTVKNRFKNLINRGGKVGIIAGLGTLVGTGFALADEEVSETPFPELNPETQKGIPEEAIAAGTVGAIKYGPQILKALKSVGKIGLKTVGSLPAAGTFAGMEIKKGMGEGQSFVDAASDPLVGLELLLPETVKKLGPLMARAARISTPIGATITTGGTLKNRAKEMMRQAEGITALPEGEKQRRFLEEYAAKDYKGYNQGGRVNFADGPEDPKKKSLIKKIPKVGKILQGLDYLKDLLKKKTITVKRGESGTEGASSSFSNPDYKGKYYTPEGGGFETAAEDARYYSKMGGDEGSPKVFTAELTPEEIKEGLRLRALDSQDPEIGDIILPKSAEDKIKIDYLNTIRAKVEKYLNMAEGGRVNFADGPEDPKKRKFMKIMGGLASLPIVGRLFDVAQVAEKTAPVLQKTVEAAPAHFWNLVAKIKTLGDDISLTQMFSDREKVFKYKNFELSEDINTGRTQIQRMKVLDDDSASYYGQPLTEETYMSYTPSQKILLDESNPAGGVQKTIPEYEEGTAYLRSDREYAGEVVDEMSGVADDIFEEAGVPVPEKIRKK